MKYSTLFLFFLMCFFTLSTSWSQKKYEFSVTQSMLADTTLQLSFYVKSKVSNYIKLGNTNIAVRLNLSNLDIANAYKVESKTNEFDGGSNYRNISLGKRENLLIVSVLKISSYQNSKNGGSEIIDQQKLVAKINIPVIKSCATSQLTWENIPVAVQDYDNINIKNEIDYKPLDFDFKLEGIPAKFDILGLEKLEICEGQTVELNTNSKSKLVWYKDGIATNLTTSNINISESGTYSAIAVSCNKTLKSNNDVLVQVNPLPTTPIITQSGTQLISSQILNQWYKDSILLVGETNQSYKPVSNGVYYSKVSNDCGSKISNSIIFDINVNNKIIQQFALSVYPNPIQRFSTIDYTLPKSATIKIEVWSLFGQKIATANEERKQSGKHNFLIDIEKYDLKSGSYILKFFADTQSTTTTLIINK